MPTPPRSQRLQLDPGVPVVQILRTVRDAKATWLKCRRLRGRGDKHQLRLR